MAKMPPEPSPDQSPGGPASLNDSAGEGFTPKVLDRTVIAIPLFGILDKQGDDTPVDVIIDLNLSYPGGRKGARERVETLIDSLLTESGTAPGQGVNRGKSNQSEQYLFARLSGRVIRKLVRLDQGAAGSTGGAEADEASRALYRIWPDFEVGRFINASISTVKADAARNAFGALGRDIVWAVMDSGIDRAHPHFLEHKNLELKAPVKHRDFTSLRKEEELEAEALVDENGHGTHVAGIIAGGIDNATRPARGFEKLEIVAAQRKRDENNQIVSEPVEGLTAISGMAPQCRLLSLKVLDEKGKGQASSLIAAIEYIQRLNDYGRTVRVHGVNMSVGYDFKPEWFACGQSPLCVEVDRLVKSGVVVVVAAGNTGYGFQQSAALGVIAAGMTLTINDPGNAELAITVGSTHRDMPHIYGVSYFSSKGPTGDGRMKPDLIAPGEKIISCKSGGRPPGEAGAQSGAKTAEYKEDSGTSMAAPHVSGMIAAFLSIRREFIGRPEVVKDIFLRTGTDLKRVPAFQGQGLVDLMRAIQSV